MTDIPEAVAATEAIWDYFGWKGDRTYFMPRITAIITKHMAPALEAGYKEGADAGAAQWRKYLGEDVIDACWRDSRAFAALGQTDEVKP